MAEETTQTSGNSNTKLYKVLCYLWELWLIPFLLVKGEKRDETMVMHLKQGFGVFAIHLIGSILYKIDFDTIGPIVLVLSIVLMIIGIIDIVQDKDKELPILGPQFTSWFSFIK